MVTRIGHGASPPKHQPSESEPGECHCRMHHPHVYDSMTGHTSICNETTRLINEGWK